MDARRSSLVPPQPRQAAMRDAQEAGSGLNAWADQILSDMRHPQYVLPDPEALRVYRAHQSGIPAKDWNHVLQDVIFYYEDTSAFFHSLLSYKHHGNDEHKRDEARH